MSTVKSSHPSYALAAPMRIGDCQGTTVALDLENVVFAAPEMFPVGWPIDFSIVLGSGEGTFQLNCRGEVVRSRQSRGGFETAATIVHFEVAPHVEISAEPGAPFTE